MLSFFKFPADVLFTTIYSDVRNNSLTGTIPQNIGNCTAFQVLYVSHLTLRVQIAAICYIANLNTFLIARDLSYNKLTGEIPFNIGFLQVATL